MNIELRQLRHFVVVAEELHFGRAAFRLHMTQPPLSLSIQQLEKKLGTTLFIREKRHIVLSAAGFALLPEAKRIIQDTLALSDIAQKAANGQIGHLTLAFISTVDYNVLPSVLREFRQNFPKVQLTLQEATSDIQLIALREGKIDIGMLVPPTSNKFLEEFHYLEIFSESLVLAAPADTTWINDQKIISLQQCAEQPLIIFPRLIAPSFHDSILACFQNLGITPKIGQEAIQMQTIISLVSAGMGIALVPQSVSNLQRPGVLYKKIKEQTPQIKTGLAWRKDNYSPILKSFIDLFKKSKTC